MRLSVISFTDAGGRLGQRLCEKLNEIGCQAEHFDGRRRKESLSEWTGQAFSRYDGLIFIGACGIAVRAVAPFVRDKFTDPAVVVVDERAQFSVSLLSGHVGGANELARTVGMLTGAVPVISTATDVNGKFAVDVFAKENHLHLSDRTLAKQVSAAVLAGSRIPFYVDENAAELTGRMPEELMEVRSEEMFLSRKGIRAAVSAKRFLPGDQKNILYLIPASVTVGIGCRKEISPAVLKETAEKALERAGIFPEAVEQIATIALKKEEPAIRNLAEEWKVPLVWYEAEELNALDGTFSCSSFVKEITGVDSVCERAAAAGSGGALILRKQAERGVTVAAAQRTVRIALEPAGTECGTDGRQRESAGSYTEQPEGESRK